MRFIRTALSPASKRQYLLALGKKDIELLLGEARNAYRYYPVISNKNEKNAKQRLKGIVSGLEDALRQAQSDGDEGERVPLELRQAYANQLAKNPLYDITRFEIIDSSGAVYTKEGNLIEGKGRNVVFWDSRKQLESEIQDGGRTLKLNITDRPLLRELGEPEELKNTAENLVKSLTDSLMSELEKVQREDTTTDETIDILIDGLINKDCTAQEARDNLKSLASAIKYNKGGN